MTTEDKPHVVFNVEMPWCGSAAVFPNYAEAHAFWKRQHTHQDPWLIAVFGRVIDPSAEIVDVNE